MSKNTKAAVPGSYELGTVGIGGWQVRLFMRRHINFAL